MTNDIDVRIGADARQFTAVMGEVRGSLQGLSRQIPVVGGLLSGLSGPTAILGGAMGGVAALLSRASRAFEDQAIAQRRLNATLIATGNVTGLTRREMDALARSIEKNTLLTKNQALDAIGTLSTFRGVAGDAFREVIEVSADLSQVFDTLDFNRTARNIGRALQNINSGVVVDLRDGLEFLGQSTIKTVTELARAGDTSAAAAALMDELRRISAGTSDELNDGLTGSVSLLNDEWERLLRNLGARIPQQAAEQLSFLEQAALVFLGGGGQRAVGLALQRVNDEAERQSTALGQAQDAARRLADLERLQAELDRQQQETGRIRITRDDLARVAPSLEDEVFPGFFERGLLAGRADDDGKVDLSAEIAAARDEFEKLNALRVEALELERAEKREAEARAAADAEALAAEGERLKLQQEQEKRQKAAERIAEKEAELTDELRSQIRVLELRLAGQEDEAEVIEALAQLRDRAKDLDGESLFFLEAQTREVVRLKQELEQRTEASREAARAEQEAQSAAERAAREEARRREEDFRDLSDSFFDIFSDRGASFWSAFKAAGFRALSDLAASAFLNQPVADAAAQRRSGIFGGLFSVLTGAADGGNGPATAAGAAQRTATIAGVAAGAQRAVAAAPPGFFAGPQAQSAAVGSAVSSAVGALGEQGGVLERLGSSFSSTFRGEFKDFGKLLGDSFEDIGLNLNSLFGDTISGLPDVLGEAGGGAAAGFAATSVLKGLGVDVSGTGGAIGGAIGQFLPIPGGGVIGGIVGGLLGGLFGGKPQGQATGVTNAFGRADVSSSGNRDSREQQAVGLLFGTISSLEDIAGALGGFIAEGINLGSIGTRKKKFTFDPSGQGRTKGPGVEKFDSEAEALAAQLSTALSRGIIDGVGATAGRLLRSATEATIEQVVQDAAQIESVPRRLKALTDPLGAALDDLNREFTDLRNTFLAVGATTGELADLEELFGLERQRILEDQADAQTRVLKDFLKQLTVGDASPLSLREQRSLIAPEFEALSARIAAGDSVDQEEFTRVAADLLNIERQLSGSTAGFFALFDEIRELTETAIANAEAGGSGVEDVANPFPDLTRVEDATRSTARDASRMADALERNNALLERLARLGGGGAPGAGVFAGNQRAFVR